MPKHDYARVVGKRIKRIREGKGMTRLELAEKVGVDHTALSCWEAGKYMPRDKKRGHLAKVLGIEIEALFDPHDEEGRAELQTYATAISNDATMSEILTGVLQEAHIFRVLRLSYPHPTAYRSEVEIRRYLSARLLADTLELNRAEVFYDLKRFREVLSNIFRFDGHPYCVKGFVGGADVLPAIDLYLNDKDAVMLGAYWNGVPPVDRPRLQLVGPATAGFFRSYWMEVWNRGRLLNIHGARDLSAAREIALGLGLKPTEWADFVEEARRLEMEDGAPPLP